MELTDLIPERVRWEAKAGDNVIELHMRPFNLEDESFLKRAYPGTKLQEVFSELNGDELSKICFHQLEPESKRALMKIQFMDVDENGKDVEIAKTGPEKIRYMIVGTAATMDLLNCLLKTRGLSLPLLEKIVEKVGIEGLEKLAHVKK